MCVCVRPGVKECVTCAALDNRPVHALIRTRVEPTVLGAGEGWRVLAREEISGKSIKVSGPVRANGIFNFKKI